MLNYKKTTQNSEKYIEDLPTATKTYQHDNSLSRLGLSTPKAKSHSRHQHRFQQAKKDINQIINQMGYKKNINMEALERVRANNADALAAFKPGYRNQGQENYYEPADYGEYNPQSQTGIYSNSNIVINDPNQTSLNQMSLQEENIHLSKALNQQIRENNQLLRRINHLEAENDHLRNRLGLPSPQKNLRSTYYSSNPNLSYPAPSQTYNPNISNSNRYASQQQHPSLNIPNLSYQYQDPNNPQAPSSEYDRTAKFGQPTSSWNTNQMNSPKSSHNMLDTSKRNLSPVELLRELQEIKDHDEALRQKTIQMLKRGN